MIQLRYSEIYNLQGCTFTSQSVSNLLVTGLETDKTYLRDDEKAEGFFFIVFLPLRIGIRILKVLKDHNPSSNMSVNEIIYELSKMERIVEKSGSECFPAVSRI